jgi:hypothetical protein
MYGIYVASRASIQDRSAMWRAFRCAGIPIDSTWIDEAEPGQTLDYSELWGRIEQEVRQSRALILFLESGDLPVKGALVEVGMAVAYGLPVYVVAPRVDDAAIGSWLAHPRVQRVESVHAALRLIRPLTAGEAVRRWRGILSPAECGARHELGEAEIETLERCDYDWPLDLSTAYDDLIRAVAGRTGLKVLRVRRVLGEVVIHWLPPPSSPPVMVAACRLGDVAG